jgi:hypothetical protein
MGMSAITWQSVGTAGGAHWGAARRRPRQNRARWRQCPICHGAGIVATYGDILGGLPQEDACGRCGGLGGYSNSDNAHALLRHSGSERRRNGWLIILPAPVKSAGGQYD